MIGLTLGSTDPEFLKVEDLTNPAPRDCKPQIGV